MPCTCLRKLGPLLFGDVLVGGLSLGNRAIKAPLYYSKLYNMSVLPLAETLKNTIEVLNEIYEVQNAGSGLQGVLFLKLSWNIFLDWMSYILTLQWINDFIKLPIFLPQGSESVFSDLFNHLVHHPYPLDFQVLTDNTFKYTENWASRSADRFIERDQQGSVQFWSGFYNCFFLYVPLSPVQFIWLRRMIDGQGSGWASTIGIILGHLSLFGCCLFGFRDIMNVWFGLEPLSYFLGVWLIFVVIFEMAHKPLILKKFSSGTSVGLERINLGRYFSQLLRELRFATAKPRRGREELFKIFLISFGLVWTDQSGFYQYFGHLTLHSGVSLIDFSNSTGLAYYFGIIVGSFFWTYIISQSVLRIGLGYLFPRLTRYPYSYWIRGFHNFCLIGCITLTLTSFPYYGPDYLFTNPLGFFPQDNVFEATSLLKTDTKDIKKGRLGEKSSFASVDTDLSLFDRGRYAGGPVVEFHLESLNYQQEYAWRSRFDRRGLTRGGGLLDQYLTTQLGPVEEALKKQRREKKRAQQIQKIQKFKNTQDQKSRLSERTSEPGEQQVQFWTQDEQQARQSDLPVAADQLSAEQQVPSKYTDNYLNAGAPIDQYDFLENSEDLMENYEDLIERFVENYTAEANSEDPEVPDLVDEKMMDFSAFSEIAKYGFDLFSMFEAENPVDEELARDIKEKFSDNLVYRFLVNLDISNFLKRQPKEHQLTSQEEIALFEKRLALGEYYETLRSYSQLPFNNIFQPLFCGPKSYMNRIYNQQFKGTLKIVERLFSIHLENEENIPKYTDNLPNNEEENKKSEEIYFKLKKEPSVLKFDQPLYQTHFLHKNPLIHEQFLEHLESSLQNADAIPFLQEGKPLPFFVGWSHEKRKFIVTNRLLTRQKTLSETSILKDNFRKYSYTNLLKNQKNKLARSAPELGRQAPLGSKGRNIPAFRPTVKSSDKKKFTEIDQEKFGEKDRPDVGQLRGKPDVHDVRLFRGKRGTQGSKFDKNSTIQNFKFTTWPVTEKALQKNPLLSRLFRTYDEMKGSADDLYKYAEPLMEEESLIYDKLPSLVQRIEVKNKLQMSLAPTRGGFLWPGNVPFKFQFPQLSQYFQKLQKLGFF